MKLLFIYGSPAVGKYTVANEVAKKTNFRVFHNHLSIDCIKPIFGFGTPSFTKLIEIIRRETILEATKQSINLIYTFCYAKGIDDPHVQEITDIVENNGGEICFVLLKAEKTELQKRVLQESRKKMDKAKSVDVLQYYFDTYDLFTPVHHQESMIIDNTNLSPKTVALKIIKHYKLLDIKQNSRS
jgi:RNase adaptor protein for sRNA GlmZ degradation